MALAIVGSDLSRPSVTAIFASDYDGLRWTSLYSQILGSLMN